MRCDTCQQESPLVMRVVVAPGYNRALARPLYNCPTCFERKEQGKPYRASRKTPARPDDPKRSAA